MTSSTIHLALKVLKPEIGTALGPERFLREIEIVGRLNHPHIVPLYDSGHADGFPYYVMPHVKGETLSKLLRKEKQLRIDTVLKLTRDISNGLAHAHILGVVHRDIKPANVLISDGDTVIADFGIPQALRSVDDQTLTATGESVGPPVYMSPEQASDARHVGPGSDLYSLACMVYEMLAVPRSLTRPLRRSSKENGLVKFRAYGPSERRSRRRWRPRSGRRWHGLPPTDSRR